MAQKRFDLYEKASRRDYYCKPCDEVTSIYMANARGKSAIYCGHCGDNIDVEPYNSIKHGCVTGYRYWSAHESNMLKELLEQPLTWKQIVEHFGEKRTLRALQQQADRLGFKKKYNFGVQRSVEHEGLDKRRTR